MVRLAGETWRCVWLVLRADLGGFSGKSCESSSFLVVEMGLNRSRFDDGL